MAELSPLRRRMIEDMTIRNLSAATQKSYVHHVHKLSQICGRSPDRLGVEDVRAYQLSLVERGVSWGALNQAVCALRFFYGVTLGRTDLPVRIAYARQPRPLPVVLSAAEVVSFLEAMEGMKNRVALRCAYKDHRRRPQASGRRARCGGRPAYMATPFITIRTSIASYQVAACRQTTSAGSPVGPGSSCLCGSCPACTDGYSWRACRPPSPSSRSS